MGIVEIGINQRHGSVADGVVAGMIRERLEKSDCKPGLGGRALLSYLPQNGRHGRVHGLRMHPIAPGGIRRTSTATHDGPAGHSHVSTERHRGPAGRKGLAPAADLGSPQRCLPASSVDRAAMNASCGTSTRPTIFMRFLPSFCRSRSLRLREMSPP